MQPISWQIATIAAIRRETPMVSTFSLQLPQFSPHRAGQHYDVRLTAADGYQAQRSYSIASEPERAGGIDITVERVAEGEVSGYLHETGMVGDRIEVRGPIGGYFVWESKLGGPLLLVAGGSGVVPLMAMLRHRAASRSNVPARLLYSARSLDDIIYREELDSLGAPDSGLEVFYTLTRTQPAEWKGYRRRIDREMLADVALPLGRGAKVYVCGPTLMVEAAANGLIEIGIPPAQIRTERFGPSS